MRKWYRGSPLLVGFALFAVVLAGCGGGASSTAKGGQVCIATELPISGTDGAVGKPVEEGTDLAVTQAHLPGGYTLKVVNFDDAINGVHNVTQGATNMTQAVTNSCILGVVGAFNSGVSGAEIPIANAAGLAMISPGNTNPGLTKQQYSQQYGFDFSKLHPAGRPNVYFRIPTTDDVQGATDAQLALTAGAKKVHVVDDSEPYGKGIADFFSAAFTAGGGTVLGRDEISAASGPQLPALVTKIKSEHPDAVYFGGITSTGGGALRAAMGAGGIGTLPYFVGDGVAQDPAYLQLAGSFAGNTVGTVAAPDPAGLTGAVAKTFGTDFKAAYGSDPIAYSENSFDAARIFIQAITAVINAGQTPTRANVLSHVASISYDGATGHVAFDANGDNSGTKVLTVYAVQNGAWVFVKQVAG